MNSLSLRERACPEPVERVRTRVILTLLAVYPALCGALSSMLYSCRNPLSADDLLVTSCRFEPPLFDSFKANTKLSYSLSSPATVSVYILDRQRLIIKTVAVNLVESKGSHSHGWKGDSDDTLFVTSGIYIGQVKTNGKTFEATVEVFHW
jgi:hypothetical protein